ncbi:Rpn family recombination-promoting nuclease/putative transposase [Myxococcota bacterium]|nr:Rpn family recombination-promoting nuclease/putative transposase [Myxococcota bacterium]
MKTPHDLLFRFAFDDPEVVRAELRRVLPPRLLAVLDLQSLEREVSRTIDADLGEREGDVVYRVKLAGRDAFVWIIFEHQSIDEHLMGLRVLEYMVRKWTEHVRVVPGAKTLPMIIPIVVTHAEPRWRAPRRFGELYADPVGLVGLMSGGLVDFTFILDDLIASTEEEIARTSESDVLTAVLWSLKCRGRAHVSREDAWADLMHRIVRRGRRDAADAVLRYHWERSEDEVSVVVRAAMRVDPVLKEIGMGYLDRVRQESREEGREEGRQTGAAEILLKLVGLKFGAPPPALVERVRAAPLPVVERAIERILTAETVEALFSE